VADHRHRAALDRADHGRDRRRRAGCAGRARRRAARAGEAVRRRHRTERGALPGSGRAREPGPRARGVKVALFGRGGKVGSVLAPALERAGHTLVELDHAEAMVDFTAPDAVGANVDAALETGVPSIVGTSGWDPSAAAETAAGRGLALLVVPNFALGAVVMMRLAAEAARYLPRAEIVELHGEAKLDAPSGT